jgi:hypothetical protein
VAFALTIGLFEYGMVAWMLSMHPGPMSHAVPLSFRVLEMLALFGRPFSVVLGGLVGRTVGSIRPARQIS